MSEKIISHPDKGAWILDLLFDISYIIIDLKRVVLLAWRCKSQKKKKKQSKTTAFTKTKACEPCISLFKPILIPL